MGKTVSTQKSAYGLEAASTVIGLIMNSCTRVLSWKLLFRRLYFPTSIWVAYEYILSLLSEYTRLESRRNIYRLLGK